MAVWRGIECLDLLHWTVQSLEQSQWRKYEFLALLAIPTEFYNFIWCSGDKFFWSKTQKIPWSMILMIGTYFRYLSYVYYYCYYVNILLIYQMNSNPMVIWYRLVYSCIIIIILYYTFELCLTIILNKLLNKSYYLLTIKINNIIISTTQAAV